MALTDPWPATPPLAGPRLDLEALRIEHAQEMAPLLDDPGLHTFIGGVPASAEQLRRRYAWQIAGGAAPATEHWHNWVLRRRDSGHAVGTVQATVDVQDGTWTAELAWVVVAAQQGHGFATEAARVMVGWLRGCGVETMIAHVHPGHGASAAVARAIGLGPTDILVDGEVRWRA